MIRQSIRSSKSLAFSFALGVIAAAGVTGCGASEQSPDEVVAPEVQHQRVTQEDVAAAGPALSLDMVQQTVYAIDYADGPIDYSRIKLSYGQGKEIQLEAQMAAVEQGDYGEYPAPELRNVKEKRFRIASDPSYFGQLTESQLDQLKTDGYYFSEEYPSTPSSQPQTVDDDCVHAICDICVDNETGGHPVSWLPGTFTCYEIEHVWC